MKISNDYNNKILRSSFDFSENSLSSIILRSNNGKKNYKVKMDLNNFSDLFFNNQQAFYYFPHKSSIAKINETEKLIEIERILFGGNIEHTKFEKIKIFKFKEFTKNLIFNNFINMKDFNPAESLFFYFPNFLKLDNTITEANTSGFLAFQDYIKGYFSSEKILKNNSITNNKIAMNNNLVFIDDAEILRYLISSDFDFMKTFNALNNSCKWRRENLPGKILEGSNKSKIDNILNTGFIYIHGFDNQFRPNIIIRPEIYTKFNNSNTSSGNKYELNDWLFACVFILEYCINFLFIPGQVENWNLIIDLENIFLLSLPNDLKDILEIVQVHYKFRLNVIYMINLNYMTNMLWKMVKGLIGACVDKKFKIVTSKNNFAELFDNICRSQLEKKFGGYCQNKTFENFKKSSDSKQSSNFNSSDDDFNKTSIIDICKIINLGYSFINDFLAIYNISILDLLENASHSNFNFNAHVSDYFLIMKKQMKNILKEILIRYFPSNRQEIPNQHIKEGVLAQIKSEIKEKLIFYTNPGFDEDDINKINQELNKSPNFNYSQKIKTDFSIWKSPYENYKVNKVGKKVSNQDQSLSISKEELNKDSDHSIKFKKESILSTNKVAGILTANSIYESCINDSLFYKNTASAIYKEITEENTKVISLKSYQLLETDSMIDTCKSSKNKESQIFTLSDIKAKNKTTNKKVKVFRVQKSQMINNLYDKNSKKVIHKEIKNFDMESSDLGDNQDKFCKVKCGGFKMQCEII